MATITKPRNFRDFAQQHFTDTNVLIYCLLLFFLCLMFVVIGGSNNFIPDEEWQPDFKLPIDGSPAYVPIPADQQLNDNYRLKV